MNKAGKWLQYLLPLFIVLFFYLNNLNRFGHLLLSPPVTLLFFVHLFSAYLVLFFGLLLFRKNKAAALLFSSLFLIFFFAFGALQDFLFNSQWKLLNGLSNTIIITAFFLTGSLLLSWWLKKRKALVIRLNRFLLLVFTFFLVYEAGFAFMYQTLRADKLTAQPQQTFNNTSIPKDSLPDIYHLLFDSYTSNDQLEKHWQYANPLYSQLDSLGFFTVNKATSNYSLTALSLNAAFNMNYLAGNKKERIHSFDNFLLWSLNLKQNSWFHLLKQYGYDVRINSLIYEPHSTNARGNMAHGSPQTWLRLQTFEKVITDPWRFNQLKKLVGLSETLPASVINKYETIQRYNLNTVLKVYKEVPFISSPGYAFYHFLLPHYPYIFDSIGTPLPITAATLSLDPKGYLQQVQYSNQLINKLVKPILAHNPAKPKIIIISGDHGFKGFQEGATDTSPYQTITAIYFSDKNYTSLPNEMSLVNLYRFVANKAFKQNLPALKDSIVQGE